MYVFVSVCLCVYMRICRRVCAVERIHIYIHLDSYIITHTNTHIHAYIHTRRPQHTCSCSEVHTYISHACIHTYIHACMHTHQAAIAHLLLRRKVQKVHTYISHACTHTYIHTYTPGGHSTLAPSPQGSGVGGCLQWDVSCLQYGKLYRYVYMCECMYVCLEYGQLHRYVCVNACMCVFEYGQLEEDQLVCYIPWRDTLNMHACICTYHICETKAMMKMN